LAFEFFRDLTATFDQLALPYTVFTVDGIEDRPGVGEKSARPVDLRVQGSSLVRQPMNSMI